MEHCHSWTWEEDIVACYLSKFSEEGIDLDLQEIADCLGIAKGSLLMRVGNFNALDGRGGLSKVSRLSDDVYSKYKNISRKAHLKEVQQILLSKFCPEAA